MAEKSVRRVAVDRLIPVPAQRSRSTVASEQLRIAATVC